jgi:hypothetical protein
MEANDMTTERNKNPEQQMTTNCILDRLYDGRVLDTGEFYDRVLLLQQLSIIFPGQRKQASRRIR